MIRAGSWQGFPKLCCSPELTLSPTGNVTSGRDTVVLTLPSINGTGGREAGKEVSQAIPLLASLFFLARGYLVRQLSVSTSSLKGTHFRVPISAWLLLTLGHEKEVPITLVIPTTARVIEIMLCSLGSKFCFSKLIFPQVTRTWASGPCLLLHL